MVVDFFGHTHKLAAIYFTINNFSPLSPLDRARWRTGGALLVLSPHAPLSPYSPSSLSAAALSPSSPLCQCGLIKMISHGKECGDRLLLLLR